MDSAFGVAHGIGPRGAIGSSPGGGGQPGHGGGSGGGGAFGTTTGGATERTPASSSSYADMGGGAGIFVRVGKLMLRTDGLGAPSLTLEVLDVEDASSSPAPPQYVSARAAAATATTHP
jgi:hypothetical protein